jgi:two-component system cell cycle response regulator DivK
MFKLRILVIEDNPDNMDLMSLILLRAGYEIIRAKDGNEGLELALQHQPDLILLDLALPEKDGWTLAQELKGDILTHDIPIIAITAHTLPHHKERALKAGCDGFIVKPFGIAAFNEEIKRYLR